MKQKRKSVQVRCRKLDRLVAHKNMERAGLKRVNKHDYTGPLFMRVRMDSYFSSHWRDTVVVPTIDLRRKAQ